MSESERAARREQIEAWDREDVEARRHAIEQTGRVQLAELRRRLMALWGHWFEADEVEGHRWHNDATGQIIVWWLIDGHAYYDKDALIYVEREARGRIEWTVLDADGEPIEPWKLTAPPRWRWMAN